MKCKMLAACVLSLALATPVMAQNLAIDNTYKNTTQIDTPKQAPGIAVGGSSGICPGISAGQSAPGAGYVLGLPPMGKCPQLRNDGMAIANAGFVAELFGTAAAQRYAVMQSPRIREAVYGDTRQRSAMSRSTRGAEPSAQAQRQGRYAERSPSADEHLPDARINRFSFLSPRQTPLTPKVMPNDHTGHTINPKPMSAYEQSAGGNRLIVVDGMTCKFEGRVLSGFSDRPAHLTKAQAGQVCVSAYRRS